MSGAIDIAGARANWHRAQKNVIGICERDKADFMARLPPGANVDRWLASFYSEIRNSPKLLTCSPPSVIGALFETASLGLTLGATLGQAYLIPYGREAKLVIGYKGLIMLAHASGLFAGIDTGIVYPGETWREWTDDGGAHVYHEPDHGEKTEAPRLVYAVARMRDGGRQIRVIPWRTILKLRDTQSRGKTSSPWHTHTDSMARKTAIRRVLQHAPCGPSLARAVYLDDLAENSIDQKLDQNAPGAPVDWEGGEIVGASFETVGEPAPYVDPGPPAGAQ